VSFGEDLRAARKAAGYCSQESLAEAVGVAAQSVNKWETGGNTPSFENLEKLETVLGVRLNLETPVTPQDVPDGGAYTAKDEPPKPRKAAAAKKAGPKSSGMPSLRLQLEMPYKLGATALQTRLPHTAAVINMQAGPCAEAWDTFLLRYPKLREKIESGAVAADIVNLVMVHVPIVQMAREELAAQQAATFPADPTAQAA
jgi:transcriptional regulator with XRE-family HTH domain